jgi:hypothetical protein
MIELETARSCIKQGVACCIILSIQLLTEKGKELTFRDATVKALEEARVMISASALTAYH